MQTLWHLLKRYEIPTFLFVNKMDQSGTDKETLLAELQNRLSASCIDFTCEKDSEAFLEAVAMCDEEVLENYLEGEPITDCKIRKLIQKRKIFPCYFGSALKLEGIDTFLEAFDRYTICPEYADTFGAKVYKISRDAQGMRLTHLKVTGGSLRVKMVLKEEEKVDQIRIYSGSSYRTTEEVEAGRICVITGPDTTRAGEGLGAESEAAAPMLTPALNYQIELPEGCDVMVCF